jgi:6-phospho-beta-glucosidase
MKLSIIGGAGVRVPLLVNGLIRRGLPFDEIALFDPDATRLAIIARLTAARAGRARIVTCDSVQETLTGADFVVTSIRVGGLDARRHDEGVALRHGLVGQETVGPGGFAMAIRTIPVLVNYMREIAEHAPDAWVINFSNPVGVVTQAMHGVATGKVIGICDTPTELFTEIAHALGVRAAECAFDYIGLNHLGWVREVYCQGTPLLENIWNDREVLSHIYARPLFPAEYLASVKLLPTEYVYYYLFPDRAVANLNAAGTSRGAVVGALTDRLFARLRDPASDAIAIYERYLEERSGSYMQIESGQPAPQPPSLWAELTGYDRIAFDVIHAIVHNTRAIIPLNIANRGNIPELRPDDVVEVPCVVAGHGPRGLHVGALPEAARHLTVAVKEYERRTLAAAATMKHADLVDALAANPLVPSRVIAAQLIDELRLQ